MRVVTTITFSGVFKRIGFDPNPKSLKATILCFSNGQALLEADSESLQGIWEKQFFDSSPLHSVNGDLITPEYKGEFQFEGTTIEGKHISAIFINDTTKDPRIQIRELYIRDTEKIQTKEITTSKYGLTKLRVKYPIHVSLLPQSAVLDIKSLENTDKEFLDSTLNAEMVLSFQDDLAEKNHHQYAYFFIPIISFASGDKMNVIYEAKSFLGESSNIEEVIYWPGHRPTAKAHGLKVIPDEHLHNFLYQVTKPEVVEKFWKSELPLSLFWYLESFDTALITTQFILVFTAFETLIEAFQRDKSSNKSNRLLSSASYRKIKKMVLQVLEGEKQNVSKQDELKNFEIFNNKIIKSFEQGNLNQVGKLSAGLQEILSFYQVKYDDLLLNFDVIRIRNNIIHRGFSDDADMLDHYLRLKSLYVRLVLSMLEYKGNYIEYKERQLVHRSLL